MVSTPVNREMLAESAIDAVEIITPHHLHADMTVATLEAGKHVWFEPPLADTDETGEETEH